MKSKISSKEKNSKRSPLGNFSTRLSSSLEVSDSTTTDFPVLFLLPANHNSRDPQSQAARLANQFIWQNRGLLNNFGITTDLKYDGTSVRIILKIGTRIGALPLISPTTGKPDYGLVMHVFAGKGPGYCP